MASRNTRRLTFLTAGLMLLGLQASRQAAATWYYPNKTAGGDIIMGDVRWPYWPKACYFALWNCSPYPSGGSFYGGVAPYGPGPDGSEAEQQAYRPQLVWSFWNAKAYRGEPVKPIYTGEPYYGGTMSGEGATAGVFGYFPYLRHNAWMRMLMRGWSSLDAPDDKGYLGWWVQDVARDQWHCIGVVEVPCKVTGLSGTACFVEDCGAGPGAGRLFDRRLWYYRESNSWHKMDSVWTGGTVPARRLRLIEDGTALRFELPDVDMATNGTPKNSYTLQQPDEPVLDAPALTNVAAEAFGNQVMVSWAIPPEAAPQLGYRIELLAPGHIAGDPLATMESVMPFILRQRMDAPAAVGSVRLTVRDVFDRETSTVITPAAGTLAAARPVDGLRSGLAFRYYEAPERVDWDHLPDVAGLTPVRRGIVRSLDETVARGCDKNYAIVYTGSLRISRPGFHLFETRISDGYRLLLDGKLLGEDDGIRGPTPHRFGALLAEGLHDFELRYFKGHNTAGDGWLARKIWVGIEGPGTPMHELNTEAFVCAYDASIPDIQLDADEQPTAGARTRLRVRVDLKGQRPDRVDFFRGPLGIGSVRTREPSGDYRFESLLPTGTNALRARLWYADGNAVESSTIAVAVPRVVDSSWELTIVGPQNLPQGIETTSNRVSLSGEGTMFLHREVTGDFVMTGHLSDFRYADATNGVSSRSQMGLIASAQRDNPLGARFELFDTAAGNLHGSSDDRDLETSRKNRYPLGRGAPWLKIARRGSVWTAWISDDGAVWRKGIERIDAKLAAETLHLGVFYWTLPGKSKSLFHGTVDHITIVQPGVLPPEASERISAEAARTRDCVTGLVRADTNSTVLFARGDGLGLLRSADTGRTWAPCNGNLQASPEALSVRAVAVHPTNAAIILRGGGTVVDGVRRQGLWRTEDSGAKWTLVSDAIDFDGSGPRALFGETIAFNPHDPSFVVAAGETSGLAISGDGGLTWSQADLKGEPISCIAFMPSAKARAALVGTFPDGELARLGLRGAGTKDGAPGIGRIYTVKLQKNGIRVTPWFEMPAWGVADVCFEPNGNITYAATSRGVFYTFNATAFYQQRQGVEPDRLYAAIAAREQDPRFKHILTGPFVAAGAIQLYDGQIGYFWSPVWQRLATPALTTEPSRAQMGGRLEGDAGVRGIVWLDDPAAFCIATREGIFRTADHGARFQHVYETSPR